MTTPLSNKRLKLTGAAKCGRIPLARHPTSGEEFDLRCAGAVCARSLSAGR